MFNPANFLCKYAEFLDGCGIDPPIYLVCIDTAGSVAVTHHTDGDVEEVCARTVPGGMVPPLVLTVIARDGSGKSAMIKVEAGRGLRMM